MIPGDLLSAFPHRQFHTLLGLLDSWAALPNSNPNACMPMQGGSLYHFYDGLWYDPAERRTHDLPCERRTRYTIIFISMFSIYSIFIYQPFYWVIGIVMLTIDMSQVTKQTVKIPIHSIIHSQNFKKASVLKQIVQNANFLNKIIQS